MRLKIIVFIYIVTFTLYGQNPIDIKVGRQLLIDSSLIYKTDLSKTYHYPKYHHLNPIVIADKPWELNFNGDPYAAPFSGGVWYDEIDEKFKMWYSAGGYKVYGLVTCYAQSDDGINWEKPFLDVVEGTNIVDTMEHDCVTIILDKHEKDSSKRYKMFNVVFNPNSKGASVSMHLKYSNDGIHWSSSKATSGELYDRCSAYFDPFKGSYILSLKTKDEIYGRSRNFISHVDPELLVSLAHRTFDKKNDKYIKYWFNAEIDDPRNPNFPDIHPQIYNHDAIAYENLTLGFFTIWQGPENDMCDKLMIQKRNEVLVGWTKDGFNWNRENKQPFLPVSNNFKAWNAGNVQSTAGSPIIVGDSLYFYVSGRYNPKPIGKSNFATGLATLRRDGFASMDAYEEEGVLITEKVLFDGDYLFTNVDIKSGSIAVEVLGENNMPLSGFKKEDWIVLNDINSTQQLISWKDNPILSSLKGAEVKFKFYLTQGSLYSFWVSPWKTGESRGYTAGGGPRLNRSGVDIPY